MGWKLVPVTNSNRRSGTRSQRGGAGQATSNSTEGSRSLQSVTDSTRHWRKVLNKSPGIDRLLDRLVCAVDEKAHAIMGMGACYTPRLSLIALGIGSMASNRGEDACIQFALATILLDHLKERQRSYSSPSRHIGNDKCTPLATGKSSHPLAVFYDPVVLPGSVDVKLCEEYQFHCDPSVNVRGDVARYLSLAGGGVKQGGTAGSGERDQKEGGDDPTPSSTDHLCPPNEGGVESSSSTPTVVDLPILFMPRCPTLLYSNAIASCWNRGLLQNLVLLGNDLRGYEAIIPTDSKDRKKHRALFAYLQCASCVPVVDDGGEEPVALRDGLSGLTLTTAEGSALCPGTATATSIVEGLAEQMGKPIGSRYPIHNTATGDLQ